MTDVALWSTKKKKKQSKRFVPHLSAKPSLTFILSENMPSTPSAISEYLSSNSLNSLF